MYLIKYINKYYYILKIEENLIDLMLLLKVTRIVIEVKYH